MISKAIIKLIEIYAFIVSPLLGQRCRFFPTCSEYTKEAIQSHGVLKGLFFGGKRICRCHPYTKRGFWDPVPPAGKKDSVYPDKPRKTS